MKERPENLAETQRSHVERSCINSFTFDLLESVRVYRSMNRGRGSPCGDILAVIG